MELDESYTASCQSRDGENDSVVWHYNFRKGYQSDGGLVDVIIRCCVAEEKERWDITRLVKKIAGE